MDWKGFHNSAMQVCLIGGICLTVLALVATAHARLHWPYWLAILAGLPLGLVVGYFLGIAVLFAVLGLSRVWMRRVSHMTKAEIEEAQKAGGSLLEDFVFPLVICLILALILVPVFQRARQKAYRQHGTHHASAVSDGGGGRRREGAVLRGI